MSPRGAGASRCSRRWSWTRRGCPRLLESPAVSGYDARAACRSPPVAATRPPARSASASTARGRCRWCSAPRASCSRRCERFAADPRGRVHAFCHAVPGSWHAMGVMLSAAGLAALAARRCRARGRLRRAARRRPWPGRRRGGAAVPPLPGGRADAARRPRRARRVRGPQPPSRPRRARARGARRGRVRPARLARPGRRAWRATRARPRLRRRRPQRAVAADRRLGARAAARAGRRRRGRGVRRRDPRRRRSRRLARRARRRRRYRRAAGAGRARSPSGWRSYAEQRERYRALYPALRDALQ